MPPGVELDLPASVQGLPRHRARLIAACQAAMADPDVLGMAIAGSFADGEPDELSDLDLRVVVDDAAAERVLGEARELAGRAGPLVAAFTGEHVGEPRLLITLFADLVHVDFLVVGVSDLAEQNHGRPAHVLWERDGRVSAALPGDPQPDDLAERLRWFEDRMWTWCWYVHSKVLRGELYEALDGLAYIRATVLFRLLAAVRGIPYEGARRVEEAAGDLAARLAATATPHEAGAVLEGLRETMALYVELADPLLEAAGLAPAAAARELVTAALREGLGWAPPPT